MTKIMYKEVEGKTVIGKDALKGGKEDCVSVEGFVI